MLLLQNFFQLLKWLMKPLVLMLVTSWRSSRRGWRIRVLPVYTKRREGYT